MLDMARGVSQVAPVGAAGHIQDTPQGLARNGNQNPLCRQAIQFTENGFRVLYMFQYLAGYDQIKTLVSVGELLCVLDLEREARVPGACLLHYPTGEIGAEVGVRSCRLQNGLSEFTFPASDLQDSLNIALGNEPCGRSHKPVHHRTSNWIPGPVFIRVIPRNEVFVFPYHFASIHSHPGTSIRRPSTFTPGWRK